VSGAGKTWARTHDPELKDLPYVDIADIYREFPEFDWFDALHCLLKRVRVLFRGHDTVVIEGYFLPGTTSSKTLLADLKVAGIRMVMIKDFWAPYQVCAERIVQQCECGETSAAEYRRRLDLLKKCWRPKE